MPDPIERVYTIGGMVSSAFLFASFLGARDGGGLARLEGAGFLFGGRHRPVADRSPARSLFAEVFQRLLRELCFTHGLILTR